MAKNKSTKPTQAQLDKSLIDAACSGNAGLASDLLARGASAKAVDSGGFTALMWAARYDLSEVAKELLPHSDAEQRGPCGRNAMDLAREAGSGLKVAGLIDSWNLARAELAALGLAAQAPKRASHKFAL